MEKVKYRQYIETGQAILSIGLYGENREYLFFFFYRSMEDIESYFILRFYRKRKLFYP